METPTLPAFNSNPGQFIKEVVRELKKVTWPTRADTIKLTGVVIAISLLVGIYVGGLDAMFVKLSSLLYRK